MGNLLIRVIENGGTLPEELSFLYCIHLWVAKVRKNEKIVDHSEGGKKFLQLRDRKSVV